MESAQGTQQQTLDPVIIEQLRSLMKDRFEHLIDTYKTRTEENINSLALAIEKKQYDEILRIVHSIKGSSGSIGAIKLQNLGNIYEDNARRGEYDQLNNWVRCLHEELECFKNALNAYLGN